MILTFTPQNSNAKGFLSWVGDHIPIFGQIKQASEIADKGRKDHWEMEEEAANSNSQKDPSDADKKRMQGIKQIGEKGYEAVSEGYQMVGGKVMPGVTKVAGEVVDGADKINKRVEQTRSVWDRLFGRGSKPKDVDQALDSLPNQGSGLAEPQDDKPSGGAMETIHQTDTGRNANEAIQGSTVQPPPVTQPGCSGSCP